MSRRSDLPFGSEFSPSQIELPNAYNRAKLANPAVVDQLIAQRMD